MNMKNKKSKNCQIKSKFYYYFWGTCTVAVVLGQIYVGTGYRGMKGSVDQLTGTLYTILKAI